MKRITYSVVIALVLAIVHMASAQVPLDKVLSNLGFEEDASTPVDWTPTLPNLNYRLDAFEVNPSIVPVGAKTALVAPVGLNFVGVLNPDDENISAKLVHIPAAVDDPGGTTYMVTVWGNRGRLDGANSEAFKNQPSQLLVTLYGWGPGNAPVVNPNTDNWSRKPAVILRHEFTAWQVNGEWAAQALTFTTPVPLAYVTLAVSCINRIHSSFCAVDLE